MNQNEQKSEPTEWGFIIIKIIAILGMGLIIVLPMLIGSGFLDNEEQKTIKQIERQQEIIKSQQRDKFREEVKFNIENDKLTCEHISRIVIGDAKGDNSLLSYAYFKDNLRAFWNANNCGYEWNWWD